MTPEQLAAILRAVTTDSVWKIVLGAALALIGGFLAKIWDEWRATAARRRTIFAFMQDLLDSYTSTFSELVELQGQTGTIWIVILDRMIEEAPVFARNREHLILVRDTQLRRDLQSTILKVHSTVTLLRAALTDEMGKRTANAPQPEQDAAAKMTRHRFEQLRYQIDQVRDLRSRLSSRRVH